MHRSFNRWSEDFNFNEELDNIERELSIDLSGRSARQAANHQRSQQKATPKAEYQYSYETQTQSNHPLLNEPMLPAEKPVAQKRTTPDKPTMERLVSMMSDRLMQKLNNEEYLNTFLNAKELEQDNQILATQVQTLLREKRELHNVLSRTQKDLNNFKHVAGNIYLRID